MSEFRRWLDSPEQLSEQELRVLEAAQRDTDDMPAEQKEALWAALVGQLPIAGGGAAGGAAGGATGAGSAGVAGATKGAAGSTAGAGSAGAAGATKGAAVGATAGSQGAAVGATAGAVAAVSKGAVSTVGVVGVIKMFALGAGLATAAVVGHEAWVGRTSAPKSQVVEVQPAAAPVTSTLLQSKSVATETSPVEHIANGSIAQQTYSPPPANRNRISGEHSSTLNRAATEPTNETLSAAHPDAGEMLRREAALTAKARRQLNSGDAMGALATLNQLDESVPSGVLYQERESLTIQALARSGRRAQAIVRAKSFLARFPASPHATAVRAATGL